MTNLWREPFDLAEKAITPSRVLIDDTRCKGCAYCTEFCPRGVLEMTDEINAKGYALPRPIHEDECAGCGLCETLCPEFAIHVVPSASEG
ncbi:MAG: 4Fe-4S binding protein [Chloroflexota bacterium]